MKISDPLTEYTNRLHARRAAIAAAHLRDQNLWKWRRVVFAAGLLMIGLGFAGWLAPWWLLAPLAVFIAQMVKHQQINEAITAGNKAAQFYEYVLARLDGTWPGQGNPGERFQDARHPYAEDLDVFGRGSLFELLCTARTRAGEERLANWLLAPATVPEIQARQSAVNELRDKLDLREDLALLGDQVRVGVHHAELAAWALRPAQFTSRALRIACVFIGLFALTAIILWFAFGLRWLAASGLLLVTFTMMFVRHEVGRVISEVEHPKRDLNLLTLVLARLEQEQFTSPRLAELRAALDTNGQPPSHQIAELERLCDWLDWTKNQFFAPFAFLLLVPVQVAIGIERWKARCGSRVPRWLDAIAEFEALNSLAGYAYEHPHDPFPEIGETSACFVGTELGHPLLPESRAVCNDVRLDAQQQLLIVSGSNMSGKSTLMRTVGVNVVLALAGAPVRAQRLRLTRLNVGASIHILDSLQAGASRFYAEITRLRQIVELTRGELPLLFLLDEILSGTNSHDRAIGASAVVKGLVERGALGLVTTHDLALTRMADELNGRAVNVHFEDELKDGKMSFDYHMRPGVVQRSNALELMRAVGLQV